MNIKNQSSSTPVPLSKNGQAKLIADTVSNILNKNVPLFIVRGLQPKHMEALYAEGYFFYSQGKYKEALPLFKGLTFYHPIDQRGWLGAAGCYEMLKQYREALSYYSVAAVLNIDDPMPPLHAFDCYIALKDYPHALDCLEAVILLSSKKPEHEVLKKRAEVLRDALQKNIAENKTATH